MEERNRRLERENARKRENRSRKQRRQEPAEIISEDDENLENFQETDDRPLSANIISEDEHKMLKKFQKKWITYGIIRVPFAMREYHQWR